MKFFNHIVISSVYILFFVILSGCSVSAASYDKDPTLKIEFSASEQTFVDLKERFEKLSDRKHLKYRISMRDKVYKKPNSFYYIAKNKNFMIHSSVGLNDNFTVAVHNTKFEKKRPSEKESLAFGQEIVDTFNVIDGVNLLEITYLGQ